MYRLSEKERAELLRLTRENNQLLKAIVMMLHKESSEDFSNNIIANFIGNGLMPIR